MQKNRASKNTKRDSKKNTRGATRDANEPNENSAKWGRKIILSIFAVGIVYSGMQFEWRSVFEQAYHATNRPLANVRIEGEFKFVSKGDLENIISSKLDGRFVDLDLGEVKRAIEVNPWIQEARIERIWPDSLNLEIVEHKPIARWNSDGYINSVGELIKVKTNENLSYLPQLSGEDSRSRVLAKNYVVFSDTLKRSQLRISALSADSTMSWEIQIDGAFSLVLGRDDIQTKLENFQHVFEAYLKNKKMKIERIDMRYEQGLAVQWKEDSELVATNTAQ